MKWLRETLLKLPKRTSIVIYGDINSQFGYVKTPNGWQLADSTAVCTEFNVARENLNGTGFRRLCEDLGLVITQTYSDLPPTFASGSTGSTTRIDHIAVP
eukprot:5148128-Lingulodinium_polyedra.AAC.1